MAEEVAPITINLPSKYAPDKRTKTDPSGAPSASSPPLDWLARTWSVTHSTLSMWRDARNVRITYKVLEPKPTQAGASLARIDDLVEYEPGSKSSVLKSVHGVDTQSGSGGWDWRGKGWLFFVGTHWELLGWGESALPESQGGGVERWAVTWFAPTVFTKEGVDVYCDRREGLSEATYARVRAALAGVEAEGLRAMVERDMRPVEIKLPWTERK
ncbi:hypothetical protein N3K66_007419 [Trichothecium roseum]|uniref:Uncharacterized protein n=1 Tax=Trichothecium roseum TaxID=47278 RepID=A0ACC0UU89_9HYPO|nr:hypothetical protein N3K66_007419 [Trichothecium roseum]